jgi:hypothetical protein
VIYLCVPYHHRDETVREQRFRAASAYAASLMAKGIYVFSPISHSHPLHKWGQGVCPHGWGFWKGYDFWFLARCEKVIVLKLPGWEDSTGITEEVAYANEHKILVEFVNP